MAEPSSQGCRAPKPSGLRRDNIQPLMPAPETSPQPGRAWLHFHPGWRSRCGAAHFHPSLTEFSPIPTSSQCPLVAQHKSTESHWGLSHLEAAASQLVLPTAGICGKPELFPRLAHPKAQHPWGYSAPAFTQHRCTGVHQDRPHHPSKARHRSMGCKDRRGPALSTAGRIPPSLGGHHSPGEIWAPEERGSALP